MKQAVLREQDQVGCINKAKENFMNCAYCRKALEPNVPLCSGCQAPVHATPQSVPALATPTGQNADDAVPAATDTQRAETHPTANPVPMKHATVATLAPPETITTRSFNCSNCSAPLSIPKNSKGIIRCQSCKTESVFQGLAKNAEIAAKENINSGIPLNATAAVFHRHIVSLLYESPDIPIDVFDEAEVVREERHCVPAYCFFCNGTMSFTYEAGNIREHKTAIDLGDKVKIEKEHYTEWSQMNGSASATATIFVSGCKHFASQVKQLYMQFDSNQLVDIEELELGFPPDMETHSYNLPQPAAFNEYVKPYLEECLMQTAENSLKGKSFRSLTAGGSKIDKEITRVFLGLYRIVYTYRDCEYSIWATGDGQKILHDELPTDPQRKKALAEKQEAASIRQKGTGHFVFGFLAFVIAAFVCFYNRELPLGLGGLLLVAGAACGAMIPFAHKSAKEHNEVLARVKNDFETFEAQLPDTVRRFKEQKKALRGIYEAEVTGDAEAF